ncbi:MAG: tyrosine-type recombinase/integrase, partial [Actinobacteria bacterium]|nr:tyrosine-type recombinase/integrase [Actinomycetota bacterium]
LVEAYLRHLEVDKGRKHSTLVRYRGLVRCWIGPVIGDKRADRVRPDDVDRVLGEMRRADQSASSIHQVFTLLNGAFKWAKRNRWSGVRDNPLGEIEKPRSTKPTREVVPPDLETLRLIIATALETDLGLGVACQLGAVTGMRRGELAGLRWSRRDWDTGQIGVDTTVNDAGGKVVIDPFTKTRRARWVGVDPATLALLRRLRTEMDTRAARLGTSLGPDAFVFSDEADCSAPTPPEYLSRRMKRLRDRLDLDVGDFDAGLQALRHWTQTSLNEAGFNPQQVALRGGHTPNVMNRVYVHRTKSTDQQMTDHIGALLTEPTPGDDSRDGGRLAITGPQGRAERPERTLGGRDGPDPVT